MFERTLHELMKLVSSGEVKAEEVYNSLLDRIGEYDGKVNAYITVFDEYKVYGEGILMGLPIAIKDNMLIEGTLTTCGSRMLSNYIAPYDATVISLLKSAGASFIGKCNMDEFAMGSSTETSYFGPTRNPFDLERVPGGSSGGSAAAVASGMAIAALGSDTGGSIRQPASLCGVVGFKPTYGLVSRYGLVAFASSLDQIGPITRDVTDAAILMNIIHGYDPMDSTSLGTGKMDFTSFLTEDVRRMRVGVYGKVIDHCSRPVAEAFYRAIDTLKHLGCEMVEIDLPNVKYSVSDYHIIAPAEASSNLARYDGVKYGFRADNYGDVVDMYERTRSQGFGDEVKRRIMLGTYVLSSGYYDAYYVRAQKLRTLIKRDFDVVFENCDCVIMPTSPTEAFRLGEKTEDPLQMYLSDIFTIAANLASVPAISVPMGFSDSGLPLGLQIIADRLREDNVFKCAYAFEQQHDFHRKIPYIRS